MLQVQLILAEGSHAGTTAEIRDGYYMIGRHKECQIRPKSRSVSRRHLLIHHQGDQVQVMDLASTSGTRINGDRIEAKTWIPLEHNDQLRCGKVAFEVTSREVGADQPALQAVGASEAGSDSSPPSMLRGGAWHEVDVASFLQEEDEAERERRYEEIRTQSVGKDVEESNVMDIDTMTHGDSEDTDHGKEASEESWDARSTQAGQGSSRPAPKKRPKTKTSAFDLYDQ
ncbi:MAG: FHA domain-containing protein [Planctomycetota bacterium]